MKTDLVNLTTIFPDGRHSEEVIDRKTAADAIRIARRFARCTDTTVTRVLKTSHVVIRTRLGMVTHLTWAESEVRVQARLAKALAELEWRRSVL